MSDVKIIGRAIPQQFDTYKLGAKTAAPSDGELIYELDEEFSPSQPSANVIQYPS